MQSCEVRESAVNGEFRKEHPALPCMHNVILLPSLFVRRGPRGLPDVPAVRVLGGEHPLLAGLRGPQEGAQSGADRGEGM